MKGSGCPLACLCDCKCDPDVFATSFHCQTQLHMIGTSALLWWFLLSKCYLDQNFSHTLGSQLRRYDLGYICREHSSAEISCTLPNSPETGSTNWAWIALFCQKEALQEECQWFNMRCSCNFIYIGTWPDYLRLSPVSSSEDLPILPVLLKKGDRGL